MSIRPRRFARTAVLTFALVVPTVLVAGSPAHAEPCSYGGYVSYASDYARTSDVSGGCTQVSARHYYDPVWSSNNYYSSWQHGGDIAQSIAAAELISGQHSGY